MGFQNRDDHGLVLACLQGQQAAWDALVERYERLVYSVALKSGIAPADADDVFQAVFISLFRNLESLKDESRVSAWLITTSYRESWRVAKRRQKAGSDEIAREEPAAPSSDELEALERQQLVRQALTELGGPCQTLLTALFLGKDEVRYDAIARELGIPIGSIGPTRARCLKKLEKILAKHGFADECRTT